MLSAKNTSTANKFVHRIKNDGNLRSTSRGSRIVTAVLHLLLLAAPLYTLALRRMRYDFVSTVIFCNTRHT